MHCDQNGSRRAKRRQGEVSKLGRTIDDDSVIALLNSAERICQTREKERVSLPSLHKGLRTLVLEFHQFEVAGHQIEAWKVGLANNVSQLAAGVIVADSGVKRFIFADVELRLVSMQRGETGLRIKINGEHPITLQSKMLREVGSGRCLA